MHGQVRWAEVAEDFAWDGSLRHVYVSGADRAAWEVFLAALPGWGYEHRYLERGRELPLPSAEVVLERRALHDPELVVRVGRARLACYFLEEDELELELDPRAVVGQAELDALLEFMARLGDVVRRRVTLAPENMPDVPLLVYDPERRAHERIPP